jgi:hypothetical protein
MHNAILLMEKGKTAKIGASAAHFGLVNHIEMILHHLLGKTL